MLGVVLVIATTYLLGRYPHDVYYNYHCFAVISLVALRFYNYKKKRWHYYLLDFCYFGNTLFILFLTAYPKNEMLFKMCFVYANGPFSVAIAAFKNSMIFHKLDTLISLTIHVLPMVTAWNLKWSTIPYENTLDKDKRYFFSYSDNNESTYFESFYSLFLVPLAFYFVWVILYYIKNFIVSPKKI